MLLCILIRWVVFVVIFRDEFSTICQSFIVFIVRKGVIICNLKMDLKSEFGCPNTAEERERCAGEAPWPPRVEAVCHTGQPALWSRVAHAPHMGTGLIWPIFIGQKCPSLSFLLNASISLHLFSRRKNLKSRLEFSLQFSQLPNTITFSYEVRIEWFKLAIVRNRVLYLFQVILQSFDLVFKMFYPENRDSSWWRGIDFIFVISSFITFNLLRVSSSICMCMYYECYREI